MNNEIWKDIPGYEWLYKISNHWNVYSCRMNRLMSLKIKRNLYPIVSLFINDEFKKFYVHRIVAQLFIDNIFNKKQVNHIDWNRYNNHVSNLEWVTANENIIHAWVILWYKNMLPKVVYQYSKEWIYISTYSSIYQACKLTWIDQRSISRCCSWKRVTAYWYMFMNNPL